MSISSQNRRGNEEKIRRKWGEWNLWVIFKFFIKRPWQMRYFSLGIWEMKLMISFSFNFLAIVETLCMCFGLFSRHRKKSRWLMKTVCWLILVSLNKNKSREVSNDLFVLMFLMQIRTNQFTKHILCMKNNTTTSSFLSRSMEFTFLIDLKATQIVWVLFSENSL